MAAKIFLLKYGRCSHAKCLFCGYGTMEGKRCDYYSISKEIDDFFSTVAAGDHVKVFGSGSFLDPRQMPPDARAYFIEACRKAGVKQLTIESRPEYITSEALEEFAGIDLTVAIGLEAADDKILDKLNKGFHKKDFEHAAIILKANNVKVRAYLLANPPYVADAGKSLDSSVKYALKYADSVVLINLLPHYAARLMKLWLRGEWNYLSKPEFEAVVEKWRKDPRIEMDAETFRFTPKFPPALQEKLSGVGEEYLTHPHFEVWQDYLIRWYEHPKEKNTVIFLPCSHKKPYSESETHRGIIARLEEAGLRERVHEVMLSNAGVIPREFEAYYPFNAYDWDESLETEEIKARYIQVTARRIKKYLSAQKYGRVLCFLKYSSESYKALSETCSDLGLELRNLLSTATYEKVKKEKRPLQTQEALDDLSEGLKDEAGKIPA
jgi:hypothetical protein